jgi:hypothetical protein
VSFLRRLIALAVLALWLPATLHCSLEAAGLDNLFRCADDEHEGTTDTCDLVENGTIKPALNTAVLASPVFSPSLLSLLLPPSLLPLLPPAAGVTETVAAPREIRRTWHFVARAAPPARAPSLAS